MDNCENCSCGPADEGASCGCAAEASNGQGRHAANCLVCGAELLYLPEQPLRRCHECGRELPANAECASGHFVCDACHSGDAMEILTRLLIESTERDLLALFQRIRGHRALPDHGPEHHGLVPGVIVAAFRNSGGPAGEEQIRRAVQRGAALPGGACGFQGICGAAAGVGTAFSVLLEATPFKGSLRGRVQQAVVESLGEIARQGAARCCQRDGWLALRKAAELSETMLGIPLRAEEEILCRQAARNSECIREACPLWPGRRDETP